VTSRNSDDGRTKDAIELAATAAAAAAARISDVTIAEFE